MADPDEGTDARRDDEQAAKNSVNVHNDSLELRGPLVLERSMAGEDSCRYGD
jgi:hypothetical protein